MPTATIVHLTVNRRVMPEYSKHTLEWHDCVRCDIGRKAHKHVFCRGHLPCDVLMIGEGPGKTENLMGYPFVGRSGKVLDEWIEPFRDMLTFAITNVVACRPTDKAGKDRRPTPAEAYNCRPRLDEIIAIARPRAIVFLGKAAAEAEMTLPDRVPQLGLYHPSYILRTGKGGPTEKREKTKLALFLENLL